MGCTYHRELIPESLLKRRQFFYQLFDTFRIHRPVKAHCREIWEWLGSHNFGEHALRELVEGVAERIVDAELSDDQWLLGLENDLVHVKNLRIKDSKV